MASDLRTVEFFIEQAQAAGSLRARKMFGEYALYLDEKVVAFVCDNQLFVKPTAAGRQVLGGAPVERPPYPGGKPHFLLGDAVDDRVLLATLLRQTAAALPPPKTRRKPAADPAPAPVARRR